MSLSSSIFRAMSRFSVSTVHAFRDVNRRVRPSLFRTISIRRCPTVQAKVTRSRLCLQVDSLQLSRYVGLAKCFYRVRLFPLTFRSTQLSFKGIRGVVGWPWRRIIIQFSGLRMFHFFFKIIAVCRRTKGASGNVRQNACLVTRVNRRN